MRNIITYIQSHQLFINTWCCFAFLLPLSIKLTSIVILVCGAIWLLNGNWKQKWELFTQNKIALLLCTLFLCYVASSFFSTNKHEAFAIIERHLSLIAFPLMLGSTTITNNDLKKISFSFLIGIISAFIICLLLAVIRYNKTHSFTEFFYQDFTEPITINAVYMSAYTLFAIHMLFYFKDSLSHYLFLFTQITLIVIMLLLSSKLMLLLLILSPLFYVFKQKIFLKKYMFILVIGATFLILLAPPIRQRFITEWESNFKVLKLNKFNYDTPFSGTSLRLLFWKLSIDILNEENSWLCGVGTGDFQDLLNQKYKEINLYTGNPELGDHGYIGYGPHNQFIETLLSMGILVLLFFIYLLYIFIKTAIVQPNTLALSFLIICLCFFISESVFSMNKGILFFTFFSILLLQTYKTKPLQSFELSFR